MLRTRLASVLLLSLGAPIQASLAQTAAPPAVRAQIQALMRKYADTGNRTDAEAMMQLYSRSPGVIDVEDGEIHHGWDDIRSAVSAIVGKVGVFNISLGAIEVFTLGPGAAYAVAPYMVHVSTDKGPAEVHGAMTFIFQRAGTSWSIIHTHASTKVDAQ